MVHFFLYDYRFEQVWKNPDSDIERLSCYRTVLSPDFSIYLEMDPIMQFYNVFRNRWCGAYWASKGIRVIPTVNLGDESTFDFCFDRIEEGGVVAVSTYMASAYTGPRAPSARSISPTLPERSPTIPRAVLEERPCQPRRRAEPGISHRSRGWGCRWQSKQSPVIECDSGKSVIPPAWHRRFPRIPVPLHAGSSNPIQGHRGNRRD